MTINSTRLNRTLAELGRFGATPHGMHRLAFSPADVASREYTMALMRRAGLEVRIDPAGNIIGRKAGSVPGLAAIALGSHTDTVPNGGKYDGALGVMAAIECVQALSEGSHALRHPVEVLVFTNEEGTRFRRWLLGSRAMAGLLEPGDLSAVDDEGVSLGSRLADIGGDLGRIHQAQRKWGELAAYFELHIEQGPVLHQADIPIGVVTGITGRSVFEVEVTGAANHAGTTPMNARRDALVAASRLVLAVNRLAAEQEVCRVATVGAISAQPNAVNVIPGQVRLGVEFRDLDMVRISRAEEELRHTAGEISSENRVQVTVRPLETTKAAPVSPQMQELVLKAAARCGLAQQRLPSGAGHDAQAMAAITDVAMVFVPSVGGISHSPEEFSTPEACANGTAVLLQLLLLSDKELP